MRRERVSSGTIWEDAVGYSRAVCIGPLVYVSGTTAMGEDGSVAGANDPYAQAKQDLGNLKAALHRLGAGLSDVVRTRFYVTDIDFWEEVGRAHGEMFGRYARRPVWSR